MKADAFLNCLAYYGINTGINVYLQGMYAANSGTTGVIFNQIYSSGAAYTNGQIDSSTIPLINVYGSKPVSNGIFSGNQGLKIGYQNTGNFSLVMDIEYSGCNRQNNQSSMILLSTASGPSGLDSGFSVGITESHRLYFGTSGYYRTLSKELSTRNYVYVSLAEKKYVTMGIYDFNDDKVYRETITMPSGRLDTKDIYIGNFLKSSPSEPYTGFSGIINQVIFFNDSLTDATIGTCSNCALTTGFITGSTSYLYSGWCLTGVVFSGQFDYVVTGYGSITGNITNSDGSLTKVLFLSGITGYLQTGIIANPLFYATGIQYSKSYTSFLFDTQALNSISRFSLYFNMDLASGDSIEIYSYPTPNPKIGREINSFSWPEDTGVIQLYGNGLSETIGVDYNVIRNNISGFYAEDILTYDTLRNATVVTAYSGYWNDISKIQLSGGVLFPSSPQYFEHANFTGIVKITGLSGVCVYNPFFPQFGYDIHMNGQKLISGVSYSLVSSGTSGFVVSLSGKTLPILTIGGTFDITGGGPIGVDYIDDNELTFIPQFSGFYSTRIDVTQNGGNSYTGLTGFSEQIWINGIRQKNKLDYIKVNPCSLITGVFNPPVIDFAMYDSDATASMWNMQMPPTITGVSGNGVDSYFLMNWNGFSPIAGNVYEVYSSLLTSSTTYGNFNYNGMKSSWKYSQMYSGYINGSNIGSGILLARFHAKNMASDWFQSTGFSVYQPTP